MRCSGKIMLMAIAASVFILIVGSPDSYGETGSFVTEMSSDISFAFDYMMESLSPEHEYFIHLGIMLSLMAANALLFILFIFAKSSKTNDISANGLITDLPALVVFLIFLVYAIINDNPVMTSTTVVVLTIVSALISLATISIQSMKWLMLLRSAMSLLLGVIFIVILAYQPQELTVWVMDAPVMILIGESIWLLMEIITLWEYEFHYTITGDITGLVFEEAESKRIISEISGLCQSYLKLVDSEDCKIRSQGVE